MHWMNPTAAGRGPHREQGPGTLESPCCTLDSSGMGASTASGYIAPNVPLNSPLVQSTVYESPGARATPCRPARSGAEGGPAAIVSETGVRRLDLLPRCAWWRGGGGGCARGGTDGDKGGRGDAGCCLSHGFQAFHVEYRGLTRAEPAPGGCDTEKSRFGKMTASHGTMAPPIALLERRAPMSGSERSGRGVHVRGWCGGAAGSRA